MNVQHTIIAGIKEQLYYNDYLVLPNFGGFVLKRKPAHFAASGGILVPASKTVGFNSQLKQNDGVLAAWLQKNLGCTQQEGLNHLNDFSAYCSSVLVARRRLSLDGIGFFYLDFENNICFEPQADVNLMTESFGLSPLSVNAIAPVSETPKREPVFEDRPASQAVVAELPSKPRRRLSKIVTPVLLVLVFFACISILVTNTKINGKLKSTLLGSDSKSTFVPLAYPDLKLVSGSAKNNTYVTDAGGVATIQLEEDKMLAVKVLDAKDATPPVKHVKAGKTVSGTRGGNFEIVLGCFAVLENAEKMVNKLSAKHVDAYVSTVNHKGMHVVSLGNFTNKDEALNKLLEVKDSFPHAWIKKP